MILKQRRGLCLADLILGSVMALAHAQHAAAQTCQTERISEDAQGVGGNGYSIDSSLSRDGRLVAYDSDSTNLVPGDTNHAPDVFVFDRSTGGTVRASVTSSGGEANSGSAIPILSGDGRYVAFRSVATNLDPRDADPSPDIYLHDLQTGQTVLVSERVGPGSGYDGCINCSVSDDGRYVAFDCFDDNIVPNDPCPFADVYVKDMLTGAIETISVGNQGEASNEISDSPSISADGRYVAFASMSTAWFPGNPLKNPNVYVRDRILGTTKLISHVPSGGYSVRGGGVVPSISADGRKIAFLFLGRSIMPSVMTTTVKMWELYVRDLEDDSLALASSSFDGGQPNVQPFAHRISGNGRYLVWQSYGTNYTVTPKHGQEDIFLHDLETGTTVQVSRGMNGEIANDYSIRPSINYDGRVVAFASRASNLVPGDVGQIVDIFVRECDVASPTVYCASVPGSSGCAPAMSFQGTPSATAGSGFLLRGDKLVGKSKGLLLYGIRGDATSPLLGGWLCFCGKVRRTRLQSTGGTSAPACDGTWSMDMNAWIAAGVDPFLTAGTVTYAQVWCRDPADPDGGVLSDAVAFVIEP